MPNYDPYTENLADFGMREIEELRDILTAWLESGLPDDFDDSGVKPAFNMESGYVFLTNDEYQVCMEVDGKLESFYTSPYYGTEGFYEDLLDEADSWDADNADEDLEWLRDIAESRGDTEGVEKLNALIDAFNANNGIEESTRTSKQAVTAAYGTWHSFYGLPDVEFRVVNDMSDPDLSYNGDIYNYYDVEDALWSEYKEYCEENGCIPDEDDFANWIAEDHERVYNWLADLTPTGRKRAGKDQLQRSVRSSKSAKRRFTVTAASWKAPNGKKYGKQSSRFKSGYLFTKKDLKQMVEDGVAESLSGDITSMNYDVIGFSWNDTNGYKSGILIQDRDSGKLYVGNTNDATRAKY